MFAILQDIDDILDKEETLLIHTDSHALLDTYENMVQQSPTVSDELKSKMGALAATLRNIEAHVGASKKLNLKIRMSWQSNHHDEPYDSDNFQDHTKKCNHIVDGVEMEELGFSASRLCVRHLVAVAQSHKTLQHSQQ